VHVVDERPRPPGSERDPANLERFCSSSALWTGRALSVRLPPKLKRWTVVGYDRRDWAGSRTRSHRGLTLDDHDSDVVRALRTFPKPVVAGHSYGGLASPRAAARRPVTRTGSPRHPHAETDQHGPGPLRDDHRRESR
jgi:Alpha/beta hydrolase family